MRVSVRSRRIEVPLGGLAANGADDKQEYGGLR
jgi:hypothetical protein